VAPVPELSHDRPGVASTPPAGGPEATPAIRAAVIDQRNLKH
jgi:hypothetical protein